METFSRGTFEPWWVTGFVDGVGSFTFSRSGRQIGLYFAVRLAEADRAVLEKLQQFFGGIGKIYKVSGTPRPGSESKIASYFRVTRLEDLKRVVDHFDRYPLQTAKHASYEIWREMVILKQAFRKPDRKQLNVLAAQLSAASTRNQPMALRPGRILRVHHKHLPVL
jgi:LAGLIDADG endonuclease